jgi:putative ABC transport system permease protein
MKKYIKWKLALSSIALFVLILVCNYFNFMVSKNVSNIIEYKSNSENGISFNELSKVKAEYKDLEFSGSEEIKSTVTNKYGVSPDKEIKTKIVLTDENYFDLYPFEIIKGGRLSYLSVENGDKIAIISDILATSLFKSTNVIGSTLVIKNDKYKIAGVYKEDKSLLYTAAEDGYERVYIPYTAYNSENTQSKLFLNTLTTMETKNYDENRIGERLTKVLGDKLSLYKCVNYKACKNIIFQNVKILYFLICMTVIVFLISIMLKVLLHSIKFIKEKTKVNYFSEVIKSNKKEFITFGFKILLCVLAIIVLFNLAQFKLVIDNKYLPSDNIFDIDFYRKAIISNIQLNNAGENGVNNVYNRYLDIINNIDKVLVLLGVFSLERCIVNYRLLNRF